MSDEKVVSRTVAESQAERSEIIFPADSNALGNLFGGRLMQFIDLVGAVAAVRHSRAIVVSASMDHSGFCGAGAYWRSADSEGEREPGVPDQHGGWRSGDGGGCAGRDAAACVVGVCDVCGGRPRRASRFRCRAWFRRRSTRSGGLRMRARRREMRAEETKRARDVRAALGGGWHV